MLCSARSNQVLSRRAATNQFPSAGVNVLISKELTHFVPSPTAKASIAAKGIGRGARRGPMRCGSSREKGRMRSGNACTNLQWASIATSHATRPTDRSAAFAMQRVRRIDRPLLRMSHFGFSGAMQTIAAVALRCLREPARTATATRDCRGGLAVERRVIATDRATTSADRARRCGGGARRLASISAAALVAGTTSVTTPR